MDEDTTIIALKLKKGDIDYLKGITNIEESSIISQDRVKILPTEQEKKDRLRRYRKLYRNKPEVIEKRKQYLELEDVKIARQNYSNREDIKERKKYLAKLRRQILREFINNHGELYEKYKARCEHQIIEKKNRECQINRQEEMLGVPNNLE